MSKLIMCYGLPGSGKTTWAKEYLEKNKDSIRISKDDLRAMLFGNRKYRSNQEGLTIALRDRIAVTSLSKDWDVIIDDTNLNPIHEQNLRMIASAADADFEIKVFNTTLDECIKRDIKRPNSVGERVIRDMHNQYLRPKLNIEQNADLPPAVIADLDGTLCLLNGRNPYDASDCEYDELNKPVWLAIRKYIDDGYKLIITSGRSSKYLEQTDRWLGKHGIKPDLFIMRKEGDDRKDYDVKREMFLQNIADKYYVEVAFDDRNRVVDAWRDLGITVFQVADGNF